MLFISPGNQEKFRKKNETRLSMEDPPMPDKYDRQSTLGTIERRRLLKAMGAALAAPAILRNVTIARAASKTEISFASAKFFGKSTVAQVVDAFNQSQDRILVNYDELPPPSASTEVHQRLVQRLAKA